MPYKIDTIKCLKCGACVKNCPDQAIIIENMITESDGLKLFVTKINTDKCTECGACVSYEWWCPAKAIDRV